MASEPKRRIKMPKTAKAGEVISIRCMINHRMESGLRKDVDGKIFPRQIINRFTCDFNGLNVIDMIIEPGVSANPFLEFDAKVDRSGKFHFVWYDDDGSLYEEVREIDVS